MTSYRDFWVACPHCQARQIEAIMMSTNNAGWTIWSDGYEAGVFNRRRTRLRMCAQGHPFMIGDAEQTEPDRSAAEPPRTIMPDFRQLHAIADGVDDPRMVREARLFAWWAANAREREHATPTVLTEESARNAKALMTLLLHSPEPFTLAKGQIARQFGWHTEAEATYAEADDLPDAVRVKLIGLCRRRSPRIERLSGDGV